MVDITPMIPADRQVIDGFGPGQICVAGQWRDGALIVLSTTTLSWAVESFEALTLADFQPVIDADPAVEILLLGCGRSAKLLPKALRQGLRDAGIVTESMDTAAACRTFNVLLAEERRVAAAILPL